MLPGFLLHLIRSRPGCVLSVQSSTLSIPVAVLAGIPVIHRESSNSREALGRHAGFRRRVVSFGKRCVYRACAFIVANSSGAAESVEALTGLPEGRIRVIHNPVDPGRLSALAEPSPSTDAFAPGAPPVLAYVGRLSWEKDVATLLRGFAIALPGRRAQLLLIGDGRDRAALQELALELGVADAVRFLGHVANPHAYVARSCAFLLSSLYEGLPNALLEAVALGVPSISTDCPTGPREILLDGDGGWLVPVGDATAFGAALGELLDRPDEAARRAATATAALARFHPSFIASRYAEVILNSMHFRDES